MRDMWTFVEYESWSGTDITGFTVQALDGDIGSVDEATYDVGSSYVVVDTGPWIFGKKVLLPAGIIQQVDIDNRRLFVSRTQDEIKSSPEFDESRYRDDPAYRAEIASYYAAREPVGTTHTGEMR